MMKVRVTDKFRMKKQNVYDWQDTLSDEYQTPYENDEEEIAGISKVMLVKVDDIEEYLRTEEGSSLFKNAYSKGLFWDKLNGRI